MRRLWILALLALTACGVAFADIPTGTVIVMTAPIAQGPCVQSDIALFTPGDAVVTIENGNIVTTWISNNVPTNQPVQFNLILAAATPCLITGAGVFVTTNGVRFTPITVTAAATGKNLTVTLIAPATLPTTTSSTTTTSVLPTTTVTVAPTTTVVPTTPSPSTTTTSTSTTIPSATTTVTSHPPINGPATATPTTSAPTTSLTTPSSPLLPPTL